MRISPVIHARSVTVAAASLFAVAGGCAPVARGGAQSGAGAAGMPHGWPVAERVREYTDRAAAFGFTGGVLVAHGGEVIHVGSHGFANRAKGIRFSPTTPFDVGSFTKQFTAGAILKLVDQGKLSVNDSLHRFFPGTPADKRNITVHQLLSNSSGLAEYSGGDFELVERDALIAWAMKDTLDFAPGSRYMYSNVGFSLLAAIVEVVSGQSYEAYLRENVFRPAGMTHTGYVLPQWNRDSVARNYSGDKDLGNQLEKPWLADGPSWNLRGNGGMLSTLDDLSRWYHVLRDGKVISLESIDRLATGFVASDRGADQYGYAAFIRITPYGKEVAHGGGASYGTSMNFRWFPEADALVTFVVNQPDVAPASLGVQRSIRALLADDSVAMPPRGTRPSPTLLAAIAGTYELEHSGRFRVESGDSVLVIRSDQAGVAPMLAGIPPAWMHSIDSAIERRILDAARALGRRDAEPLIRLSDPSRDLAGDREFWTEWSDTTARALGNFRNVESVAVLREPRGLVVHMWMIYERGARPLAVRLLGADRVAWGFRDPLVLQAYRFRAMGPDRFVWHHLDTGLDLNLEIRRSADGNVIGLQFRRGNQTWIGRRVSSGITVRGPSGEWTPVAVGSWGDTKVFRTSMSALPMYLLPMLRHLRAWPSSSQDCS